MRKKRWRRFFERTAVLTAVLFVIAVIPLPVWTPGWFLYWQVPATVFLGIAIIGKLLIDTIIYPDK